MDGFSAFARVAASQEDDLGSGRHAGQRLFTAFVGILLIANGLMSSPAAAQTGPVCTDSALVPQLASSTVNQGLPYTTLVRGKEALVRFYLRHPQCASSTQRLQVKGATLAANVSGGAALAPVISCGNNVSANICSPLNSLADAPAVAPYSASTTTMASNTSPANPLFRIDPAYLNPANPAGTFNVTFSTRIIYSVNGGANRVSPPLSTTPVAVAAKTSSLRILSVPMGAPATGFTQEANLINGFKTLARLYPVPQGTGKLEENVAGGIRYKILPALMDISRFMTGGQFCGDSVNTLQIRAELADYLAQYNTANEPAKIADRVLGAVDTASSLAGTCAQGYAGVGTKEAWVRTPDTYTGSLMGMEESHNAGATTPLREDPADRGHSPNTDADGGTNRAYNLTNQAYITAEKSVMNFGDPTTWKDDTTLLERPDWEQVFCRLGGPATSDCAAPAPEGAILGAAAGPSSTQSLLIGLTDDTAVGTDVFDSYFAPAPAIAPPASSEYRYIQLNGSTVVSDTPVAVHEVGSVHDNGNHTEGPGFFSIAYPFQTNATRWELWKGPRNTAGSVLLAGRDKVAAPVISDPELTPLEGETETIDFEDGTPLQPPAYEEQGVTFATAGTSPRIFVDPTGSSPTNTLVNDGAFLTEGSTAPLVGTPAPMTIDFATPNFDVAMEIGNGLGDTTATLTAFDADGDEVDSATVTGFTKPVITPLAVESAAGDIERVTLSYSSDLFGASLTEQIDNLAYTPVAGSGVFDASTEVTTEGNPNDLRGAYFVQCPVINSAGATVGSMNLPVKVSMRPSSVNGQTATFEYRFDSANSCEDGGTATLLFRAADGYTISEFVEAAPVAAPDSPPKPVIASPIIDAAVIEHQYMSLSGQGYDATDGVLPGNRLEWFVSGPEYGSETLVGTGADLDVPPPDGRWTPGDYQVRLQATDFDGNVTSTTAPLMVLTDADNDGIPADDEACYAGPSDPTPDSNPFNAYSDFDGDGYLNVDDEQACVAATSYQLTAHFLPRTINTGSDGTLAGLLVVTPYRNLNHVVASSLRVTKISGVDVSPSDPDFNGTVTSWNVIAGVGIAGVNRQDLIDYLEREGLVDRFITVTLEGTGATGGIPWEFEAYDPQWPYVKVTGPDDDDPDDEDGDSDNSDNSSGSDDSDHSGG